MQGAPVVTADVGVTFGEGLPEVSAEDLAKTPESVLALILAMAAEIAALRRRVAALEAENAALRERLVAVEAENARLRERLGLNSRNSSKPPSSDPPGTPAPPPAGPSKNKRRGQKGHARHDSKSESRTARVYTHGTASVRRA